MSDSDRAIRFNKIASRFTRGGFARALAGSKMENVFSREKSRRYVVIGIVRTQIWVVGEAAKALSLHTRGKIPSFFWN